MNTSRNFYANNTITITSTSGGGLTVFKPVYVCLFVNRITKIWTHLHEIWGSIDYGLEKSWLDSGGLELAQLVDSPEVN